MPTAPIITVASAIPIRIPLKKVFTIAVGCLTHSNHVLVRLEDDHGRVGWGETSTFLEVYGYDQTSLYRVLTDYLLPAMVGQNPFYQTARLEAMNSRIPDNRMAKAAVDAAALDLAAQSAGVPVCNLIGGRYRDRIPLIGAVDLVEPAEAAEIASRQTAAGHQTIKIKIGGGPEGDLARVAAVRKAVADNVTLRVDGNCAYDLDTALRLFGRMADFHLEWIEQPLPAWNLYGHRELAQRLTTPIALDESIQTVHDAYTALTLGAARVINIKVAKCGGIYQSQQIAAICRSAGATAFLGGVLETSPGLAAAAHCYAATPAITGAAEIGGPELYVADPVITPLPIQNGAIILPDVPGWGVEVDEEKVEFYRTNR